MRVTPEHEELKAMLPAAALEILEMADREQVLAHIADCPECADQLADYRMAAAALGQELPARHLDPAKSQAVRERLMARVRADRSNPRSDSPQTISFIYPWAGWMVAAGMAGILLTHHSIHRPVDYGWLAAGVLVFLTLGFGIYAWIQRKRVVELERRLGGEEVKGTSAQGSQDAQSGPRGGYSSILSQG